MTDAAGPPKGAAAATDSDSDGPSAPGGVAPSGTGGGPDRHRHRQALFALGWSSIGTVVMFAANGLTVVVLSRLVAPTAFGVIAAAAAVGLILKGLGPFAVTQATLQVGDRPGALRAGTNVAWAVTIGFAALLFVSADLLGGLLDLGDDAWVLRAWVPILLCQGAVVPAQIVLQRALRFKEITIVQSAAALIGSAVVPIVLAVMGMGVGALYLAVLAQAVIELIGLSIVLGRVALPGRGGSHTREIAREARTFSLLFAVSSASTQGDNLVVAGTLGNEALGFYSRAYKLMALPANMLGDAIDTVLFPVILGSRDDKVAVARGVRLATLLLSLTLVPISAISVVLGELVVSVLLGSQWLAAVATFQVLAAGMYFRVATKPLSAVLRGLGHQRALTGAVGAYAVGVVGAALLGGRWGIEAVAVGVVVVLVAYFLVITVMVTRVLGTSIMSMLGVAAAGLPGSLVAALVAYLVSIAIADSGDFVRLAVSTTAGLVPPALIFLLPGPRRSVRSLLALRRETAGPGSGSPAI